MVLEIFPSRTYGMIFFVVFFIFLLFEIRVLFRSKEPSEKSDLVSVLAGIFLPLLITIFLVFAKIGLVDKWVSYIGFILLVGGFVLRQCSIMVLGRFFVPVIKKQKGQKVIKDGPYRFVRHPSYTGLLLELVGFSLALTNLYGVVAVLVIFVPVFMLRIEKEEEFLRLNLKGHKG
jgi:protein-S-isoprenylcysteine O-methyltransferase Ste14